MTTNTTITPLEQTATMARKHARIKTYLTVVFAIVGALAVLGGMLSTIGKSEEAGTIIGIILALLVHNTVLIILWKNYYAKAIKA